MRFTSSKTEPKEFRCCIFFHVRAGTLLYGLYFLLTQLIAFCFLTAVTTRPELARQWQHILKQDSLEGHNASDILQLERAFIEQCRYMWLITLGALICGFMLVYGSIKGRSSYLLPFLVLQVFDFFLTCLTVIGCFAYIVDVQDWVSNWSDYPYLKDVKEYLLTLSPDTLMLLFVILFVAVLVIKAYLLGMVWNTHKYFRSMEVERFNNRNGMIRRYDLESAAQDSQVLLPPKYEDAIKVSAEEPAPPPYTTN